MSGAIVIDSSAVMAVLRDEPPRMAILSATAGRSLVGAETLPLEVMNGLSSLLKQGKVELEQAVEIVRRFDLMKIRLLPVRPAELLSLVKKHRAYAYDCGVVDLASHLSLELLTLDRGMIHVATAERVAVLRIAP